MGTQHSSLFPAALALVLSVSACQCGDSPPVNISPDKSRASVTVSRTEGVVADGKDSVTIQVQLTGRDGKPAVGAEVEVSVSGTGNVLGAPSPTNEEGISTTTLATTRAEHKEVSVSVKLSEGAPVALAQHPAVTFVHGPSARLAFTLPPSAAQAGTSIAPSVQVVVQDAQGNAVTESSAEITLQFDANPAGGTLSGTASRAASAGVATFEGLRINRAGQGYSLRASSPDLEPAVSEPFAITVGAPARLAFSVEPAQGIAGQALAPAVQVAVQDEEGNPVTSSTAPITIALGENPGTASLKGTLTIPAVDGVATFADLSLDKAAEGYRLAVTSPDLEGATSAAFTIVAGEPAEATTTLTAQPTALVADGTSATVLILTARDALGNPVPGQAVHFTASGTENMFTPADASATSDTGEATVALSSTHAEAKMVTATVGGFSLTANVTFKAGAPVAATSTFSASPASVVADGAATSTLTVTLHDANNNPIPGAAVSFSSSGTANAFSVTTGTTDASGVLNTTLSSTKAEAKTVTATVGSLSLTTSVTFTPGQPSDTHSQLSVSPASVATNGSSSITVTVLDANNNAIPGVTVVLTATGSTNTFSPSGSGTSNGSGVFTATLSSTKAEAKTVTARIANTFDLTATVTFVPGPPDAAQSSIAASPTSVPADGTTASQLTVTVRDAFGNPVPGSTVSLSASGANPTVTQPSAAADAAGVTSGSVKSSTAGTTTVTATVNPGGVVLATQPTVTFENTYYVNAATGLDTNPGTKALPWKTLTKAITTAPAGVAYIYVAPGTYSAGETFPITPRANQHLIGDIANKGNGPTPTRISGGAPYNCSGGDLANRGYITAVGLEAASNNASLSGFSITNPAGGETVWICNTTATLANNTLFGATDTGLLVGFGANVTLTSNDIRDGNWNALFYDAGTRVKARGNTFTLSTQHAINLGFTSNFTGSGIDLGTAADPGNNTILGSASGVGLNFYRPTGSVVQAAGNTWKANVQGANAQGKYASQLISSSVGATGGNNYTVQVTTGGGLQF